MMNLEKIGVDYTNYKISSDASVTLYHLPKNSIDCSFWRFDRKLLLLLNAQLLAQNGNSYTRRAIPMAIEEMFGPQIQSKIPSSVLSGESFSIDKIFQIIPTIHPNEKKYASMLTVLNESITDYSEHNEKRAYLIIMHEPDNLEHVYMTMSIRFHSPTVIEHRHIQQSVRAIIEPDLAPFWGYEVSSIPKRMSLRLHGELDSSRGGYFGN